MTSVAVQGNTLYWLDNQTNIKSMSTTGGPITTIFSGPPNGVFDFIMDQNNIFFIQQGSINKISLNGAAVTPLVPGADIGSSLESHKTMISSMGRISTRSEKSPRTGDHSRSMKLSRRTARAE